MKYYGIHRQNRRDDFIYAYAKAKAWLEKSLPGSRKDVRTLEYNQVYSGRFFSMRHRDNSIPSGHYLKLDYIVTAELVYREDIIKLQKGLRSLLKERRSLRPILGGPIDSIDGICQKINQMDSVLERYYNTVQCGIFDFSKTGKKSIIEYFSVDVKNINSSYLSVEFVLFLSKEESQSLNMIIDNDYKDKKGYAQPYISCGNSKKRIVKKYLVTNYNEDALKADKIYEHISCLEWEFYNEISQYFPFVLFRRNIRAPRIEVFSTDIDYHERHTSFWSSVGITDFEGQFIDSRQKIFFDSSLSGRYENIAHNDRLIYIYNNANEDTEKALPVSAEVHLHLREYGTEYFKFLFLNILEKEVGEILVTYKQKLDRVKLNKGMINKFLKLQYLFARDIDFYTRYTKDNIWEDSMKKAGEVFDDSYKLLQCIKNAFLYDFKSFCANSISALEQIHGRISAITDEFNEKGRILQCLYDYKNEKKNQKLNILMLVITLVTLFYIVFPEKIAPTAQVIRDVYHWFLSLLP